MGILADVKKTLGIPTAVTDYDVDILMHINAVLSVLDELGIGPSGGLAITDNNTDWSALLGTEKRFNLVKTYICLRVRRLFDPPTTSYLLEAYATQIQEMEWRIVEIRDRLATG